MGYDINRFSKPENLPEFAQAVFASIASLETQLNSKSELTVNDANHFPAGLKPGRDLLVTTSRKDNKMRVSIPIAKGRKRDLHIQDLEGQPNQGLNFLGITTSAAPPSLTEYPNDKDWGFHTNTADVLYYLVLNIVGVLQITPFTPFVNTQYLGQKSGANILAATVLAAFPVIGDFGFFFNTATARIYLVKNVGGATFKVELT